MKKFKAFIEGLGIDNGKISVDYNRSGDIIDTKMGKKNRQAFKTGGSVLGGHEVFSSYVVTTAVAGAKDILTALKGKNPDLVFGEENLTQFLSRTTQHLLATALKSKPIDIIVTIKSSSDLTNKFAKQFTDRISNEMFFPASVFKATIDKVHVADDVPNEKMRSDIQRVIDNVKKGKFPYLEMKKLRPQDRKFILDFMQLDTSLIKKLEGANVLIVDDYITSGTTIGEAMRLMELYSPASITGVTLFKIK